MARRKKFFQSLNYRKAFDYYQQQRESKGSMKLKVLILVTTTIMLTFFFSYHTDHKGPATFEFNTTPGSSWPNQNVIADFSFPIDKDYNELQTEIRNARSNALPVFKYSKTAAIEAENMMNSMLKNLEKVLNDTLETSSIFFTEEAVQSIKMMEDKQVSPTIKNIKKVIVNYLNSKYETGFIDVTLNDIDRDKIKVVQMPNKETILNTPQLTDAGDFLEKAEIFINNKLVDPLWPAAMEIVSKLIFPNLKYSAKLSSDEMQRAEQSVARTNGIFKKGETIIEKGQKVTENTLIVLKSYYQSRFMRNEGIYSVSILLGSLGHAALLFSILVLYLFFIRRRIFADNFQLSVLSGILVLVAAMSWLSIDVPSKLPLEYFICIPAFSMLVAIVYDSRTAFYTTVTMALLMTGIRGNDFDSGLAMLIAGMLAAYTVRDLQSRTQMYQSIGYILIGFVVSITAISFERSTELMPNGYKLGISLLNALVAPLITFGLLFILERFTNITTDLKIQEYDRHDHPLLVKLSEIAPGTYQHTMSVAMLAEKCAAAVNANPLLTKVGTYFHDIGKMKRPDYFVENQGDKSNKHDKLAPARSAEAIKSHVYSGIKMAQKYKLPQRIIDFIPMHHGTSLIKHFYALALEEAKETGKPIEEKLFRYPGPKPNSKEAAILMICDAAEAMGRLMANDPEKLNAAMDASIKDRLYDGQFDDCNITLNELQIIKETCLKNLAGISHKRVQYKEIPKDVEDSDKEK